MEECKYKEIAKESFSIAEMCRKLGIKAKGGNYQTIKSKIKLYNIDTSHFTGQVWNKGKKYRLTNTARSLEEVLTENSTYQSNKLRRRLIESGLKEHKCEKCGATEWLGKPIKLELHHINGNKTDNRLENLQILCPNCHSYTDTYRAKNKKRYDDNKAQQYIELSQAECLKNKNTIKKKEPKKKRFCLYCGEEIIGSGLKYCSLKCMNSYLNKDKPTKEDLIIKSKEVSSLEEMSKSYNITSNGLKKWLIKYNIYDIVKQNFKQRTYPIMQYSLDFEFIKEWKDGNEIEQVLGFHKGNIQRACSGIQKVSYNFIWRYKKDI